MIHQERSKGAFRTRALSVLLALLGLLSITGCLEQYQTTRLPSGALNDFFIHLQNGELDDARTYFAPGLVTPSASLDDSVKSASSRVRRYEFRKLKYDGKDLANGQRSESLSGQYRLHTPSGQPTPTPDEGWTQGQILSAVMVERGPGWRLLHFDLDCCP